MTERAYHFDHLSGIQGEGGACPNASTVAKRLAFFTPVTLNVKRSTTKRSFPSKSDQRTRSKTANLMVWSRCSAASQPKVGSLRMNGETPSSLRGNQR